MILTEALCFNVIVVLLKPKMRFYDTKGCTEEACVTTRSASGVH